MLELRNITKVFGAGTSSETIALNNVNLLLNDGDFITVIGGNGAGKSTLTNIIAGAATPDTGKVLLNNNEVTKMSEHKRAPYFGRVFQDPMVGTAADMTVIENLALAYGRGKRRSLFRWSYNKRDVELFKKDLETLGLGLEDKLYQKVGLLSGGQRQALTLLMATTRSQPSYSRIRKEYVQFFDGDKKAAKDEVETVFKNAKDTFAKAKKMVENDTSLTKEEKKKRIGEARSFMDSTIRYYDVTKPVLLLDEHTAALDPKTAEKVLSITDRIVKENSLTTIMITHNMKDAIKYGNRLIMMSKGKIVVDVSGEEKKKLTIEALLEMFSVNSKNDFLSDSAILGD